MKSCSIYLIIRYVGVHLVALLFLKETVAFTILYPRFTCKEKKKKRTKFYAFSASFFLDSPTILESGIPGFLLHRNELKSCILNLYSGKRGRALFGP